MFDAWTHDNYNNLNKDEFKTTVDKKLMIWKMQKSFCWK